jgi:hypothetical protein
VVPHERRDLRIRPALLLQVVDRRAVHVVQHPWLPSTGGFRTATRGRYPR